MCQAERPCSDLHFGSVGKGKGRRAPLGLYNFVPSCCWHPRCSPSAPHDAQDAPATRSHEGHPEELGFILPRQVWATAVSSEAGTEVGAQMWPGWAAPWTERHGQRPEAHTASAVQPGFCY